MMFVRKRTGYGLKTIEINCIPFLLISLFMEKLADQFSSLYVYCRPFCGLFLNDFQPMPSRGKFSHYTILSSNKKYQIHFQSNIGIQNAFFWLKSWKNMKMNNLWMILWFSGKMSIFWTSLMVNHINSSKNEVHILIPYS